MNTKVIIDESAVTAEIDAEAEAARIADVARREKLKEEALIDRWDKRIAFARKHDEDAKKQYAHDRQRARGESDWLVDTNLIGAILEILMSFIYAKDPDVNVRPAAAVGQSRIQKFGLVAKTIEVVIARMLKFARLKTQAKRWVRSAMTVGVGWLKAGIQTRTERDPIIESKINSLQDNAKRLALLQAAVERGDVANEDEANAQIDVQIKALQAQLERQVAEGAYIDFMAAEDVLVAPECGELENYLNSPWIAFDSYHAKDEAQELTDWPDDEEHAECINTANLYMQKPRKGESAESAGSVSSAQYVPITSNGEGQAEFGFVRVIEIWSKRDGMVYTKIEGVRKWARQPYAPRTGSRFYPCFQLAFHYNDCDRHPQSDVKQLDKLQDEYGRTRSNFAEHRRRAIPATLFDETQIAKETMENIKRSESNEFIGVSTTNGAPMQNCFFPKPYPQVDPGLYTTDPIRVDMEKVSGAQDAQQGSVAVEKTLGEAEIQQSGFMARTGARRDTMDDVLSELCEYLGQVALQVMDAADAVRYAGDEAVWVQLTVEEALGNFDIEVKAGSTGKPQNSMDKQTWGTLLPLLQQLIDRIGQARVKGEEWAAKPWIALLRETAKRLDDRIDVDALLPVPPPPMPLPGAPGAAAGGLPPELAALAGAVTGGQGAPAPDLGAPPAPMAV